MSEELLQKENDRLMAELQALKATKSGRQATNRYIPPNADFANTVHKKVTTIVWDDVKFVSDANYEKFTLKVFRQTDDYQLVRNASEQERRNAIAQFHKDYGPQCVKSLNEFRSSRQTELKNVYDKYQQQMHPSGAWPTAKFWLSIALRKDVLPIWENEDLKLDNGEIKTVTKQKNPRFEWFGVYWEELVRVVSCANTWGVHSRHYNLMSSAVRPSDLNKKPEKQRALVTVSNEAFLILSLENNEERWPWHNDWVKENPGKAVPRKHPNNQPKYSHPTGGPCFYGSWQDKGRVRFVELMDMIGDNRKNNAERVKEADKQMLDFLREHHGIQDDVPNLKKKRKKNEPAPPITTIEFEDSEAEED